MSIFNEPTYVKKPDKTNFDLSFENKASLPIGRLCPTFVMECVPGDRVNLSNSVFARTQAMIAPAFQRYDISQHFFFVPYRLLWSKWENFITGGADGNFTADVPYMNYGSYLFTSHDDHGDFQLAIDNSIGSIYDYLGFPIGHYHIENGSLVIDSRPFYESDVDVPSNVNQLVAFRLMAYSLIFKSYYKDENIDITIDDLRKYICGGEIDVANADVVAYLDWLNDPNKEFAFRYDQEGDFSSWIKLLSCLFPRSWKKDYFTSALPWAQRGDEATLESTVPLSLNVEKNGFGRFVTKNGAEVPTDRFLAMHGINGTGILDAYLTTGNAAVPSMVTPNSGSLSNDTRVDYDPNGSLRAVGTLGSLFSINDLRRMVSIQSWLERNARGGSRYVEQILAHFGVRVPDARLMRPEYLGGTKQAVQVSAVEQNASYSSDGVESPLGNLAGRGTSANSGHCFNYHVLEHGLIIGISSVMPRASYQQGLSRFLTKRDKFDYYFPEFAHLGEQEIKNKEIYYDFENGDADDNDLDFGYQMRFSEYKANHDEIHGDLRQSLDFWHDGRIFGSRPELNQDFLLCQPTNRPFAVTDSGNNNIIAEFGYSLFASRPMPRFGTPKLVG